MNNNKAVTTVSTHMSPLGTATCNSRWVAALLAGSSVLTGSALATNNNWIGTTSDWNTPSNWSLNRVPVNPNGDVAPMETFDDAIINTSTPNPAVISATVPTPRDILVGTGGGSNGRLNHTAGSAATGGGNWMFVGTSGGTGAYNLANTAAAGGSLTGFAQGTGNLTVGGRLYIGGRDNGGAGNGTVNVNTSGTLAIGNDLTVGSSGGTGVMNVDSGTVTTGGWNFIGRDQGGGGGNGTLNMSGGTLTNTGRTYVAQTGTTGKMVLSGGDYLNVNNEVFMVGEGATSNGEVVINNANSLLQSGGEFWLGQGVGSNGKLTLSAGAVTINNWVAIGRDGGTGLAEMTGGSITKTGGGNFIVGASGPGTMNQSAGLTDVQGGITWVGETNNSTGNLNLSGTAEYRTSVMELGVNAGSTGNVNLNGGTLRTGQIRGGNGGANVSFNGTQIIATAAEAAFINNLDTAVVAAGGLKIDSNTFSVGVNQILTGAGAITKSGTGTLTLGAANSYAGGTTVSGGTLLINGSQTLATGLVSVVAGGTLGGSGTSGGNLSIGAGGTLAPGNSAGTLTSTGSATFSSASVLSWELLGTDQTVGGGINDLLTGVTTSLTLDGTLNVTETAAGSFLSATLGNSWRLINYTGTLTNNILALGTTPALSGGLTFAVNTATPGQVNLVVVPEPTTTGILGAALAALGLRRRRR